MHPLSSRQRASTLLLVAGLAGIFCAALAVGLWRVLALGTESTGLWVAVSATVAAAAAVAMWCVGTPLPTRAARSPYRRFGVAVGTIAFGAAASVIGGEAHAVEILAGCGVAAAAVFTVTLVSCPDHPATPASRVRRALDGMFIAGCLVFAGWVAAMPFGWSVEALQRHYLLVLTAAVAAGVVGVGAVATIRATVHRRRCLLLVSSSSTVMVTYTLLVAGASLDYSASAGAALAATWGVGCLAGAGATWTARRHPGPRLAVPLPRTDVTTTVLAAVVAAGVAVYHGFEHGPLGIDVILLALAVVTVLATRQVLARIDVRRYAAVLADREAYFRSIVAGSSDVTTVLDADRRVRWQAAPDSWMSESDRRGFVGAAFTELVHPDDAATADRQLADMVEGEPGRRIRIDARIRDAEGQWRETESTVADQRDVPQVQGLVLHTRDVGERRALERELAKLAYTDALTSLSNRRALLRTLESDVAGGSMPCTLLAIDLDGFKNINDTRGHDIGDAVLVEMAERLRRSLRPTDVAARLGGDEFAVLLWCGPEEAGDVAERLLNVLAEPYRFEGRAAVFLSTSMGIAGCATADDVESLLRNADLALRAAKQQGKNRIEAYDASFERKLMRRSVLEQELHGAMTRGELTLVYQPVISLPQRRVAGAEALIRWRHPVLGQVSPVEFIPVVEEAGLGEILAEWTLRTIAERLATWRTAGHAAWISMNLSPRQLNSPHFAKALAQALLERGVPPSKMVVEVTEQDVAQDIDVLTAQLGALRGTGVRIALDDFGSGYSSLGQLHRLPVDILKIDRDLIAGSDDGAAPLADVVVRLGERLGLATIAEGVETQAQLDVVQQAGCGLVQGYLLARPLPTSDIDALLLRESEIYQQSTLAIES
ncbi:MAG: putative bifunctional diguanylate cyclase/phosphodiesterase [Stackebrandtia sp.]